MTRKKAVQGILYWQYFFTPPGGWGNRRSYDFARQWREKKHEVWILAGGTYFPSQYPKRCAFLAKGIGIIWLPAPYHQKLGLGRRLWSFIRFSLWSIYILWRLRHRGLYLVATLPPPFLPFIAAFRKKLFGAPFSIDVYDAWPQILATKLPRSLYFLLAKALHWSFKEADKLFALSPDIARYLPAAKVCLSYNGTRPELFQRKRVAPFTPFRVIYAGTLGWANGVGFLLHVAQALRLYSSIQFWIIGDGAERALIEAQAKNLPNLQLWPPVPVEEMPFWLSEAHIGVSLVRPLPILASNSANKFYDYLANGLVVGINYGGWQAEVLRRVQCGFSAQSMMAFAAGILRYYWDRREWEKASARARLWAEKEYDRRLLSREVLRHLPLSP
ncbi:MAG: glycosyltransferase family 4 protein [Bacteroidia bacterium]|nr:glycosyltransferase family 4 protein [Bacteroidia bacterium]